MPPNAIAICKQIAFGAPRVENVFFEDRQRQLAEKNLHFSKRCAILKKVKNAMKKAAKSKYANPTESACHRLKAARLREAAFPFGAGRVRGFGSSSRQHTVIGAKGVSRFAAGNAGGTAEAFPVFAPSSRGEGFFFFPREIFSAYKKPKQKRG